LTESLVSDIDSHISALWSASFVEFDGSSTALKPIPQKCTICILNMTLNSTENVQTFPISTLDTLPWKSPLSIGFQRKKASQLPQIPIRRLALSVKCRPVNRLSSFEKGTMIDVYA
jgi:hypothetical protein